MHYPTNLVEAIRHLEANPLVEITGPSPQSREPTTRREVFLRYDSGQMRFLSEGRESHIPIGCTLSEKAANAETGLAFDEAGFSVTKFGVTIRVRYIPAIPISESVYYEIGRDGRASCLYASLEQLFALGSWLAPGRYWICEVLPPDGGQVPPGVAGGEDWELRRINGSLVAGPGFILA